MEVRVQNISDENLDVRIGVSCGQLFATALAPAQAADLAPRATHKIVLTPDKRPAAGKEVEVAVTLQVGAHGIQEHVAALTARF